MPPSSKFTVTICLKKTKYLSYKEQTPNLCTIMHSHLAVSSSSEMAPALSSAPLSSSHPELLGCVYLAERLSAPILLLFCRSDLTEPLPSCLRLSSVALIFFVAISKFSTSLNSKQSKQANFVGFFLGGGYFWLSGSSKARFLLDVAAMQ